MAGMAGMAPSGSLAAVPDPFRVTIQVLAECGNERQQICDMLGVRAEVVEDALTQDRYATAAQFLSKRKLPSSKIAKALKMSESRVHSAIFGSAGAGATMAGRVLGSALQQRLDVLSDEDSELCCPVTLMLFVEPVIASDGFMYEAGSVKELIRHRLVSPITREVLKKEYYPAKQAKSEVMSFRERRCEGLLLFAQEARRGEARMANAALDRVKEYLVVMKPAQHPNIARRAATLWEQSDRSVPAELRPYLGFASQASPSV